MEGLLRSVNVSVVVLSSRSLQRTEASSFSSCPGMSISIVTKLQLDFHLDLVKKFFCAIGEFKDLVALVSGSHPVENVHAEELVPHFRSLE